MTEPHTSAADLLSDPVALAAQVASLNEAEPQRILEWAISVFGSRLSLAASFGVEDVALIAMSAGLNVVERPSIFFLDTGRIHQETYETIERIRSRYGVAVQAFSPEASTLEPFVAANGWHSFYTSKVAREACCSVRKLAPLARALRGQSAWITGLRQEQAGARRNVAVVEADHSNGLIKVNPLARWTTAQVWDFVRAEGVPYNPLHDRGFASIGCAPCTRAISPGEDLRAGRWWWEDGVGGECGLHAARSKPNSSEVGI